MKTTFTGTIILVILMFGLNACGTKVEVPPTAVGKIISENGFKEGVISASKFRLDPCLFYCDRLVLLQTADLAKTERMELFMPRDKLVMTFDIRATLSIKPNSYEMLFSKVPETNGIISAAFIYTTYAEQVIRAEARQLLAEYTIAEISSSREAINAKLSEVLTKSVAEKTPFIVNYIGLADISYPEVITSAQVKAAERREQIEQELAQLEISKAQLERKKQEQVLQRAIDVEKASADAEINKILADSITPQYLKYRSLEVMDKMASSPNKVFVPVEMLGSIAGGTLVGKN